MAIFDNINGALQKKIRVLNNKTSMGYLQSIYMHANGTTANIFELLKTRWNELPEGTQFIGHVYCGGWNSIWGCLYPGRSYGSILIHSYNGNLSMLNCYNGIFHEHGVSW